MGAIKEMITELAEVNNIGITEAIDSFSKGIDFDKLIYGFEVRKPFYRISKDNEYEKMETI